MSSEDYNTGDALASLMEAALRNQASNEAATVKMKAAGAMLEHMALQLPVRLSATLAEVLDQKVRQAAKNAFADFTDAKTAADDAAKAFRDASASAAWKIGGRITAGGCLLALVTAAGAWHLMPSPSELQAQRAELAQLQKAVAELKATGADALFSTCGPQARACVRINEEEATAPYGTQGDYRILSGH